MENPTSNSFDQTLMMKWIKDMSGFGPRRAGSEAGLKNEEYLMARLLEFGLVDVHKEPIPVVCRETQKAIVEIDDGHGFKPLQVQWIPYSAYTPDSGIEGNLVYADPAKFFQGGDWTGKIVLTDISFPMLDVKLIAKFSLGEYDPDSNLRDIRHPATWVRINWHFYKEAWKKGAIGFIGILKDQPGGSYRMYAPYGFKEKNILDKPLPGFWVSREEGPRLRELAIQGETRVRMIHTGSHNPAVTHNIMGTIPGKTEETVIVHCHHDSPFSSPVEDASGCSVVLAVAKHFAEIRNNQRTLLILFTAGHFYGSLGTRTFINIHQNTIVPKVALEITIEHIAKEAVENASGELVFSGRPEGTGIFVPFNKQMVEIVLESVRANSVDRVFLLPPEGPLGDYPPTDGGDWYEAGVPLINFISNPVYLLNEEDNIDWVMGDRLPKMAGAVTDIIRKTDRISKAAIGMVELTGFRLKMKLIKNLIRMKTSKFGTRPVY
ncbi:MAG: M28 family peptidase [Bacteroidales bacterium]|jgi:hypothetical protein